MYDPAIGRFTCIDPIAEKYAYVSPFNYAENNPATYIDLWGLQQASYPKGGYGESLEGTAFTHYYYGSDPEFKGFLLEFNEIRVVKIPEANTDSESSGTSESSGNTANTNEAETSSNGDLVNFVVWYNKSEPDVAYVSPVNLNVVKNSNKDKWDFSPYAAASPSLALFADDWTGFGAIDDLIQSAPSTTIY